MSRRIALLSLAASAALIATPAFADRECFEQPCQQDVAEPAASVAPPADADVNPAVEAHAAEPHAVEAHAAGPKLAPVKALPQVMAPAPVVRVTPLPVQSVAQESLAPREPARLAPRYVSETRAPERVAPPAPAPAGYARTLRVSSSEPSYTAGIPAAVPAASAVVVVVPSVIYGRYMFAPNAKIITIDSDD
jgi:hypothetical protein